MREVMSETKTQKVRKSEVLKGEVLKSEVLKSDTPISQISPSNSESDNTMANPDTRQNIQKDIKKNTRKDTDKRASRDPNKERALTAALAQIERQFGKGSMMRLGEQELVAIPAISTGSLGLDIALGIGGLPRGRVVEIYGPEASGKTTLTLQVIAEAQKMGGTCAFIDAEHALDPIYAQSIGVDTDNLLVSQPDTGEQALEICDMIVRSGAVDIVVIDSVAALTPKAEIEGEMGDVHVGLQARLMSQALRKMTANIKQSNTLVIFINQIRIKIGVMFGSPETTTGGNALKFYSSVRLDIRRIGAVKEGDEVVGNETRVKVVKNKVAPPFRQAEFQILYGDGINLIGEILELGVQQGIIEKSGAWYSYKADRIGQGRKNAADFLREHPQLREEIETEVRRQLLPSPSDEIVIPEPAQDTL
jgi:recombination protein RecA